MSTWIKLMDSMADHPDMTGLEAELKRVAEAYGWQGAAAYTTRGTIRYVIRPKENPDG